MARKGLEKVGVTRAAHQHDSTQHSHVPNTATHVPYQTPEERWRDAFKKFDKDANNSIEQDELYLVLRELGHKVRTQS